MYYHRWVRLHEERAINLRWHRDATRRDSQIWPRLALTSCHEPLRGSHGSWTAYYVFMCPRPTHWRRGQVSTPVILVAAGGGASDFAQCTRYYQGDEIPGVCSTQGRDETPDTLGPASGSCEHGNKPFWRGERRTVLHGVTRPMSNGDFKCKTIRLYQLRCLASRPAGPATLISPCLLTASS
jgi:hypothetical protein